MQQAQSGIAIEQAKGQNAQQIEQIKQQFAQSLQAQKDDAAYDREELKGMLQVLIQQMQPPPQLTADVSQDIADND